MEQIGWTKVHFTRRLIVRASERRERPGVWILRYQKLKGNFLKKRRLQARIQRSTKGSIFEEFLALLPRRDNIFCCHTSSSCRAPHESLSQRCASQTNNSRSKKKEKKKKIDNRLNCKVFIQSSTQVQKHRKNFTLITEKRLQHKPIKGSSNEGVSSFNLAAQTGFPESKVTLCHFV